MPNPNIPQEKMGSLLEIAGKKLGKSPDQLKQELEQGNMDQILSGLDQNTASKVNGLLKDPKALESMLASDKAKSFINALLGKK